MGNNRISMDGSILSTSPLFSFAHFHNGLRILMNIDRPEFEECLNREDIEYFKHVDPKWVDKEWSKFRNQPHHYFVSCCDSAAEKLFEIVMRRSAR